MFVLLSVKMVLCVYGNALQVKSCVCPTVFVLVYKTEVLSLELGSREDER